VTKNDSITKCPGCDSVQVFVCRIDSDWGSGVGDYTKVNDNEHYPEEQQNLDSFDKPDIYFKHCRNCYKKFDVY
jgi:hypothetical protein